MILCTTLTIPVASPPTPPPPAPVAAAALSVTRDPISDLKLCSMLLLSIALTVGGPNNVRMGLADGEARVLVAADWACPPEALVPPVEVPASLLGGTLADLCLAFAAAAALCLVSLYATWWELQGKIMSKLVLGLGPMPPPPAAPLRAALMAEPIWPPRPPSPPGGGIPMWTWAVPPNGMDLGSDCREAVVPLDAAAVSFPAVAGCEEPVVLAETPF